jgi:proteic killer suppression protein
VNAKKMEELFTYNSLHYERLKGDKQGFSSVRINAQYRLIFREIINSNDILTIEVCSLADITNHYK